MSEEATKADEGLPGIIRPGATSRTPALVLTWSVDEPDRIGEIVLVPTSGQHAVGRAQDGTLPLARQRPDRLEITGPLASPRASRRQLRVTNEGPHLHIANVGQAPLAINGLPANQGTLEPGDVIQLGNAAQFLVVSRPAQLRTHHLQGPTHAFGTPDDDGVVGESLACWQLRDRVRLCAEQPTHVLVTGESGTGKELVARALHRHSQRSHRPLVSRNAATFPPGLIDAELFGNIRNYPNPGTPEREGVIGLANGGVLFLDEIGELPHALQAHLLRVLDGGEYARLGDSRTRRADIRFVGATNRAPSELKSDFRARMTLRLEVPSLQDRREDVPLLARHLLTRMRDRSPGIAARFFEGPTPRITPELMRALVQWPYTTNIRQLEALLWASVSNSPGNYLEPGPDHVHSAPDNTRKVSPGDIPPDVIQAALDRHGGRQEPVWRELGLKNRHVLARLIRKYDLKTR